MSDSLDPRTTLTGRPCAQCGKPAVVAFRPFCSARCRDIDLGKWLGEAYVVRGRSAVDPDDTGAVDWNEDAPSGPAA